MDTGPEDTLHALHEHGRALRLLARSMLGSTDGADDVVPQAFSQVVLRPLPNATPPTARPQSR